MTDVERAIRVGEVLDHHVPEPTPPLDHTDPFTLLVAVLLSAQCTDERVNRVTPALFARASDPGAMAALAVEDVRALIRPCGLSPTKARNIVALSTILVERHGGQVPPDLDALEALPGVGHKTASVVMNQAFGVPAFPVDTHILRCAGRWGLSAGTTVDVVERDLRALYAPSSWGRRHLQIILFARRWCPARGHDADRCPACLAVRASATAS
jgi:endonuclease-3